MAQHFTGWKLKENQIFQGDIHGETWSFKCSCLKQQPKNQEQSQEVNLPVEMVQTSHSPCLDVACSRLGWTRPAQSLFLFWSIGRYDWSDLVNNIVFVIGVLSCRAKPADGPGNEVSCVPSVTACLRRSQKSVCYVSEAVVYEGGIHAPYTHSKCDHSADPKIICAKSITSKVCCFDSHTTQVFTLRLNSSTTWWLCFPGLP